MFLLLSTLLTFSPSQQMLNGVTLHTEATYNGRTLPLTGVGTGTKKVGLVTVKLAVNQFFSERPENFIRTEDGAVRSLGNVGAMAVSITMLRSISSSELDASMQSIISNNISEAEYPGYRTDVEKIRQAILIDSSIAAGQTVVLVGDPTTNTLAYQTASGKVVAMNPSNRGTLIKVFSAWYGNSSDAQAYNLKQQMLMKPTVTSR